MSIDDRSHERSALLDDQSAVSDDDLVSPTSASSSSTLCSNAAEPHSHPFPWRSVFIILVLNAAQPLAFELVFPFINQMILDIGVVDDAERVGFYSGIIESLFAVMSFIFVIPCSFMSDHYGRRPIVLGSIAALSVSTALFGFSKTYWFMIVTRASGGITAASWSTMKVMLGELTDKSSQAKAFAAFGAAYKIGQILGQPIGGLLSNPARNFSMFDTEFWRTYPYAFPCLFSAFFSLAAVIAGCFTLPETNPRVLTGQGKAKNYGSVSSGDEDLTMKPKPRASWSAVLTPQVVSIMFSLVGMTLSSEALFSLYPLFAFTPVEYGGLGCNSAEIGAHMAVRSFIVILLLFLFAPMQSRFGTLRTYKICMLVWPLGILFLPMLNLLKRWGAGTIVMDSALLFFFILWGFAHTSWPASNVMINDAAPSADALAAINGISQMAMLLPQAVSPAMVTSLFAWSISNNILGGYLIWIILFTIVSISSLQCLSLTAPTHDWREEYRNHVSQPPE